MENKGKYYQEVEEKVLAYCKKHHMFERRDKVVLGVSGGADSVCLLFVLDEIKDELGIELVVCHLNHLIREDAKVDAFYVERICKEKEIPFFYEEIDVAKKAKTQKCSTEEAGRNARYEFFERIRKQVRAQKIAVAHNGNDRAETMLFNLFRGSGSTGLCGIKPIRDNIVRPLLCLKREEIEDYLEKLGVAFCTDSTNQTDEYARNRIRHHILPFARENISEGAIDHMLNTADILTEMEEYIEGVKQKLEEEYVTELLEAKGYFVRVEIATKHPPFLVKRVLLSLIKELSPKHRDINRIHIEDVYSLLVKNKNRQIDLPFGIKARREYDNLLLVKGEEVQQTCPLWVSIEDGEFEVINRGERVEIPLVNKGTIIFRCFEKNGDEFPTNPYTKWFDYDKIEKPLVIRNRRQKDYLSMKGIGDGDIIHKSLKEYMIHKKISKDERERIPVLAQGEHIIWLIGYRISEYFKVEDKTTNILEVQYIETKE